MHQPSNRDDGSNSQGEGSKSHVLIEIVIEWIDHILDRSGSQGTLGAPQRKLGMHTSSHFLTGAGTFLARPIAFVLVGAFVVLWLFFDHTTFDWHGVLTVVTLCMTLFIQRSEHRDMQATQAKLDELLRPHGEARTDLATLDDKEPEEVEAFRARQ